MEDGAATREDGGLRRGDRDREEGDWCCHGVWVAQQGERQFSCVVGDGHGGVRGEEDGMVEMFMVGARHGGGTV